MIFKPIVRKHLKIVLTINVLADSLYPLEVSDYIFNGSQWIWRAASHLTISKIDYQLLPNIPCHLQRPIRKNCTSSLSWLHIYELRTNMLLLNLKHSFPVSSNFIVIIIFDFFIIWNTEYCFMHITSFETVCFPYWTLILQ